MLKLIAGSSVHSEPVVPIRWCLTPDIIEMLRQKNAANPHVLLSVFNETEGEVGRQLVPLERAMTYVQFNHPGTNTVNATIVWSEAPEELKTLLMENSPESFRVHGLYGHNAEGGVVFRPHSCLSGNMRALGQETASIDVEVDSRFFAHEPKEWEKKWVNLWFKYPPRDQCEFRRRRILAYTFQPIAMLVATGYIILFRIMAFLFLGLLGVRVTPLPIFHPFKMGRRDVWYRANMDDEVFAEKNHFFVTDSEGCDRPFGFWLLHPMHWFIASLILLRIWYAGENVYPFLRVMALIVILLATAGLVLAVSYELVMRFTRPEWRANMKTQLEARRQAKNELERLQYYRKDLADVTCGVGNFEPSISALKKRQVALLFQATKAAVCRPYRL